MPKFFRVLTHRLTFGKRGDVVRLDGKLSGGQLRALVAAGHVEPAEGPESVAPEPTPEPVPAAPAVAEPEPAAPAAEPVPSPSADASGASNAEGA